MKASTITEPLERSLQSCSLNHQNQRSSSSSGSDSPENHNSGGDDVTLELNSHISLPHHWEQCLDLKTGEIYYINWSDGIRTKEDPATAAASLEDDGDYYYSDEDSFYDSEDSSSDSSPCSSRQHCYCNNDDNYRSLHRTERENVLVVAGCKSCLMYFMVPKPVGDCPKCSDQLLHF